MAANNSISLVSLDQDTLRESLRTYLKSQSIFRGYDFDGPNLSVLIDLLAYNSWLNGFYLNMVASESFLDSAQLRTSIVSRAKELNYTPRSARSASATLGLDLWSYEQAISIPKDTSFSTVVNFKNYSFTTNENRVSIATTSNTVTNGNTVSTVYHHLVDDIVVYEGSYVSEAYIVDRSQETQRFYVSNEMIDVSSLTVLVIEDDGATEVTYTRSTTLLDVTASDPIFFVQCSADGKYEVIFGDDILGRRPKDGATVRMTYRISSGTIANRANRFSLDDDVTNGALYGGVVVNVVSAAAGGAAPETSESIRFNAPRHFQVQERCIIPSDFEIALTQEFPEISAVSAYGGEELNPPKYGKVFIAIDITDVDGLPESKKSEYYDFVKPRTNMTPVFVEPEFTYVSVTAVVKYNINLTTLRSNDIKTIVQTEVANFNASELDDFKSTLRFSRLTSAIDDSHESIVSNETGLRVYKKLSVHARTVVNEVIDFGMALAKRKFDVSSSNTVDRVRCVESTPFVLNGELVSLADDGEGTVSIVKMAGTRVQVVQNIGTVDYDLGIIRLLSFSYDSVSGSLKIYVRPASLDVETKKNTILTIEDDEIDVTVRAIRE